MVGLTDPRDARRALRHPGICDARIDYPDARAAVRRLCAHRWDNCPLCRRKLARLGLVLVGLLGLIVGIGTFIYPGITAVALLYLIAVWAVVRGIFEIITAIQLRKEISYEWALIASGIISILFGMILIANPAVGALSVVWIIGIYALVFGLVMIFLALRVRELPKRIGRVTAQL